MPNKFARTIPVADYRPRGLLPEGLIPVARPDGAAEEQLAAAANHLASTTGGIADELAKGEGTQSGKVAGNDPNYRPTNTLTIRGQAFDTAATRTYENNLDANLRTDMQSVFEANKNDPNALKKAFDTLGVEYRTKHVFPEIEGDFNAQFARLRLPYQNKALGNLEEATHDESRASLVTNVAATQTNVARMAAADPNNPQTGATILAEVDRLDKLTDQQVANQDITAEAGAKLKIKNRDHVLQTAALAQVSTLKTPEEIAAYRANAKTKFAKGEFNGLSGDGYQELDASLQALENRARTQINAGVTQLGKNLDDYIDRAASGFSMKPEEWTTFVTSPAASTPKGAALLNEGQAKLKLSGLMSKMSAEDNARLLAGMRQQLAKEGASSADAGVVQFAEEQLKKQRTALNTDQLGYAAQRGIVPAIAPIDFQGFARSTDPAAAGVLAAQFRDRTAQAHAIGTTLQRSPVFLQPEEKDRLKEIVAQGGPQALALAGAIVKGSGTDAPNVLREISPDAPLLAQAGNIIANGGSLSAARDAFYAAKVEAETGKDLPGIEYSAAARVNRDTFGAAFAMQGEDGNRIRTTADAIAKTRIASAGVDPKGSEAETIYKRALQEAAGAQFVGGVQYGGVTDYKPGYWSSYKVPVPSGIRADAFRDVIRAVRDDDLKALPVAPQSAAGKPFSARDLAGMIPVAVRGGYRFAANDPNSADPQYVRGADGAPFVLPFDALSQMAPRVSGAFLGAR